MLILIIRALCPEVNHLEHFKEIIATYEKHGWQLRRVLVCAETQGDNAEVKDAFAGLVAEVGEVDALWFSRPSHEGREAWELRLVGGTPYALFETFEADEEEEAREDVRREMEARLREFAAKG